MPHAASSTSGNTAPAASSVTLLLALTFTTVVGACVWHFDTLMMERRKLPTVLELITGKFLRHSPIFYQWRIEDRQQKLGSDPENLALLDDLAVAFDKTGQTDRAIETMQVSLALDPHRYETIANLGTFCIHAGQLEEGLRHIERAIEINPDAHFGREIYQQRLVEYVLSKRAEGRPPLPLYRPDPTADPEERDFRDFRDFLSERPPTTSAELTSLEAGRVGILGMMRFGNHDSPVLLEALADLLPRGELKVRAYLKASYEVDDDEVKIAYRDRAADALQTSLRTNNPISNNPLTMKQVEERFRAELQEAEDWFAAVVADEERWIAEGIDVDAAFTAKFYDTPTISHAPYDVFLTIVTVGGALQGGELIIVWSLVLAVLVKVVRSARARYRRRTTIETPPA